MSVGWMERENSSYSEPDCDTNHCAMSSAIGTSLRQTGFAEAVAEAVQPLWI